MNVTFYTISKKLNSTKLPDTLGLVIPCNLKKDSSKIRPFIELQAQDPTAYNYCYIQHYGRFYYIEDWTFSGGLWSATLVVDPLASFRSEIGNTNFYVLRSSAAYDTLILDTLYPVEKGGVTETVTVNTGWTRQYSAGSYVVGLISKSAANGAVAYYVTSYSGMATLRNAMLSDGQIERWDRIKDFTQDIAKAFVDPFQYVASCTWFPFSVPAAGSADMAFGFWSSGVSAGTLATNAIADTFKLAVPQQYIGTPTEWRRLAPFAEYMLILPPFGTLTLDPVKMASATYISVQVTTDPITGLSTMYVYDSIGNLLGSLGASLGIPVQLAQVSTDYAGMIMGAVNGVAGAGASLMSGNPFGAIQSAASGIMSAVQSSMPTVQTSGSTGGTAGIGTVCTLKAHFRNVVDQDNASLGRPYCKVGKPSALAGYLMVANGSIVSCGGTPEEKEQIKNYLETGFFYE